MRIPSVAQRSIEASADQSVKEVARMVENRVRASEDLPFPSSFHVANEAVIANLTANLFLRRAEDTDGAAITKVRRALRA